MKKRWFLGIALAAMLTNGTNLFAQSDFTPEVSAQLESISQLVNTKSPNAEKELTKFLKKNGKDEEALIAFGKYFASKKQYETALACAEKLYQKNPEYVPGLMFFGDLYLEQKQYGKAGEKYDEIIFHDKNHTESYLKKASVYKYVNAQTALETLQALKEMKPDCVEADKELASVYYHMNKVTDAIKTYESYFSKTQSPAIESQKEYAILLFLDKQYAKSLEIIEKTLPKDPKDIGLNRMKFYNLVEEKKFSEADAAKNNLFGQYNDTLYNYSDYMYLGRLQKSNKNYPEAITNLEKAVSLNPEKAEIYKDLAGTYELTDNYDKAIATYKNYIEHIGNKRTLADLLEYGKSYYSAANAVTDTTETGVKQKMEYIAGGDTIFADVAARSDSHLGCLWRARINSLIDPQNPVESAKNYYEETLKRLEGKNNKSNTLESLKYLAFYYMKKDDNENAKKYNDQVLAISPDDPLAKQIQTVIEATSK